MSQRKIYPNIDMIKTGQKLKHMLECAGYTPRMLQEYLHLSCVQPIYRWYKGMILPLVDHLLNLFVRIQMGNGSETSNKMIFGSEFAHVKNYRTEKGSGLIFREGIDTKPRELLVPYLEGK